MKISILLTTFLFFIGCSISQEEKKPAPKVKQSKNIKQGQYMKTVKKTKSKKRRVISNMTRGVIYSQTYDPSKNLWNYEIKVMDIASDVTKRRYFSYSKKLYDVGDLVYAIFDRENLNKLRNIYLVKKGYEKIEQKTLQKMPPKIKTKRTKANQTPWIGVPKSETVMLK